jgi:fibrillarin-like pre-rRNA processing protein
MGFNIEFEVLESKELEPFYGDHLGLVAQMFVDDEE